MIHLIRRTFLGMALAFGCAVLLQAQAPSFTSQPLSVTVGAGQIATFSATATSRTKQTPAYQWYRGSTPISGATADTYSFITVAADTGATFYVTAADVYGTTPSNTAILTVSGAPVDQAPLILTQPQDLVVNTGQGATFSVMATGTPAPSYQWYKAGGDVVVGGGGIPGATSSTFTLPSAVLADAGGYYVVVSNSLGSATSTTANLTVFAPPVITTQPVSLTVTASEMATFSVSATGYPTPIFQWYRGTTQITGATGSSYGFATVLADNLAQFKVVVTNPGATVTSNVVVLTVTPPVLPAITTQPADTAQTEGKWVNFSVAATGRPAPTYQWYRRSAGSAVFTLITGATRNYYGFSTALSDSGATFYIRITNVAGMVQSRTATLTVNPSGVPVITSQPSNKTVNPGQTATFSVAATGTPLPTFQWWKSGPSIPAAAIIGATASSYTTAATTLVDDGTTYYAVASNGAGSATSASATLTVTALPVPVINAFTAAPARVNAGGATTLQWSVTNVDDVSLDHGIGVVAGTAYTTPGLSATTTYVLTARKGTVTVTQSVTVQVAGLTWVKDIVYLGAKEVGEVDATGLHVTLTDHLGTPRFELNAAGQLEVEQKYMPFGESLTDPATMKQFAKGFTNHEQTDADGLIYMQARFYAPIYGKFLSPDPARDQHFEQTQSWNIYSYVQNNPVMMTDPTGMWTWGGVYDSALDGAAKGLTYGKMVPGLGAGIMLGEAASGNRVDTNGNVQQLSKNERINTGLVGGASLGLQLLAAGSPVTTTLSVPAGVANQGGALAVQTATVTVPSLSAVAGAAAVPAASAMTGGPGAGSGDGGRTTQEVKERKAPGRDGGKSEHIIEKKDGQTISKTHRVTKDGEVVHQHQDHVGKHGGTRRFPDEWTGTQTK